MSLSAAHLRELMAFGIAGDALARVVEIIEEVSKPSLDASMLSMDKSSDIRGGPLESTAAAKLEELRERDKIRKREERAAEKAARDAANLSKDSPDLSKDASKDKPLLDSVLLSSSLLPEKPLKESKSSGMRARGTRLAPGAPLSDEHRAIIVAEKISDPEKLWAEFVDYWSDIPGQRGIKLKWDGTLRNRCRDVIKRGFNGHRTGNTRTTGHDAILADALGAAGRLDRDDNLARAADATGFTDWHGTDRSGPRGNPDRDGSAQSDHYRVEPDGGAIREGEIIPPDKNAAGQGRFREFVS